MTGFAHTFDLATFARRWRMIEAGASKDRERPVLAAVLVEDHPGGVRLVATDTYLLATTWIPDLGTDTPEPDIAKKPKATVLVPARSPLIAAILKGRGDLHLTVTAGHAGFATDAGSIIVLTQSGEYPAWRKLFAKLPEPTLTYGLGRVAFSRLALYAGERAAVKLGVTSELAVTRFDYEPDLIRGLAMPIRLERGA